MSPKSRGALVNPSASASMLYITLAVDTECVSLVILPASLLQVTVYLGAASVSVRGNPTASGMSTGPFLGLGICSISDVALFVVEVRGFPKPGGCCAPSRKTSLVYDMPNPWTSWSKSAARHVVYRLSSS